MNVLGLKKQRIVVIDALLSEYEEDRRRIADRMDYLRAERQRLRQHVEALEAESSPSTRKATS